MTPVATPRERPETRERPILFSGPMVRAILEGRKTQTRRILKGSTEFRGPYNPAYVEAHRNAPGWAKICPYGQPGDRLWVRETFYCDHAFAGDYAKTATTTYVGRTLTRPECEEQWRGPRGDSFLFYRADVPSGRWEDASYWGENGGKWKPSIYMPRWASRITLDVTGIGVERLQDISEEDAKAEGVEPSEPCFTYGWKNYGDQELEREQVSYHATARESFESLWDAINEDRAPWASNPWVWVVEFARSSHQRRRTA